MDKLRIRTWTHHAKCSQCIRHRLIIKQLGHCPSARSAQLAELRAHLQRQYRDRQQYWAARSRSRLDAGLSITHEITGIIDSMDAQKHAWPRSQNMNSKEFSSWARPRMSSTTLLLHGHGLMLCLSPPTVSCNASRTCEIVTAGLTMLNEKGVDLRQVFLNLQADNAAKELKNNGSLRLLSTMISLHRLQGAQLSFLSTGHSHEDIDALFSLLRNWLQRHPELWTAESFRACLEEFFENPEARPYERLRKVVLLTQYRDWSLGNLVHPSLVLVFFTRTR